MVGGLSYSETHLVSKYPELVLGGTNVMTPNDFLKEMETLAGGNVVDPGSINYDFR